MFSLVKGSLLEELEQSGMYRRLPDAVCRLASTAHVIGAAGSTLWDAAESPRATDIIEEYTRNDGVEIKHHSSI